MFLQKSYDKIRYLYNQNRELAQGVLGSLGVKVLSVVVSFLTTPAYMRYFSDQAVLGVWFTLVALFNMFLAFDLGIGNGLRNRLTECLAENQNYKAKEYISSAYIAITGLTLATGIVIMIVIQVLPLNSMLNISSKVISNQALKDGVTICAAGMCIHSILHLITLVYYSLQRAEIPNFLLFVTNVLLLLASYCMPQQSTLDKRFVMMSTAYAFFSNIPLLIATVWVFAHKLSFARPSFRAFSRTVASDLLRLGLTFFALQVVGLLITSCNETFITLFMDPQKTVNYQVYNKIFGFPATIFFLVLAPFWSAVTKAKVEGRYKWLQHTHMLICILVPVITFGTLFIIPFMPVILRIWLQESISQIELSTATSMWFVFWCGSNMWMQGNLIFANGLEWMSIQKKWTFPIGVLNVVCVVIASKMGASWVSVVQINACMMLIIGILQMIAIRKGLKKLAGGH